MKENKQLFYNAEYIDCHTLLFIQNSALFIIIVIHFPIICLYIIIITEYILYISHIIKL